MAKSVKGTQTEKNLLTSFAGESQARMRYTYFASTAKKEGYEQIAAIFTETADQEKEHAKRMFKWLEGGMVEITASYPAGIIGTTMENLKAAAAGENEEWTTDYPHFADVADQEGFPAIATMYRRIAEAEKGHEERYLEAAEYARPTPEATIASKARTLMIQAPIQKDAPESASVETWAWGVNDQWEPKRSSDISKPYHYWWLKNGTVETLAYEFDQPYTVSNVQVYWLDFDHYDGDFRVPESWKLYYKEGESWKEVEALTEYTVKKDCYNSLDFKPVKTKGLKIAAQLQKGASGGVIEWKVN
ncbi:hypothetical protein HKQ50_06190 [Bacteroides vulgatus]|nr:hypothetical protein [Phocaeicola vulgatus]